MLFDLMLLPAEIESKTLIPALRAILARKLAEDHKIREDEISKMLGVTQAAISNYIRGTRGDPKLIDKLLAEEQVAKMINELSDTLASDMAYTPSSLSKFIGLCNYIKSSLLICDIHHNLESDIDEKVCKECENMLLKGPGSVY
jgi:predicted transcriptional regulator